MIFYVMKMNRLFFIYISYIRYKQMKLYMIYKKGCYYCDEVKPIIKEFEKKNKSNIDVVYINILGNEFDENKFGKVETVPHFMIEYKNIRKNFDFYDDLHQKRTYNKLIYVLNNLINN